MARVLARLWRRPVADPVHTGRWRRRRDPSILAGAFGPGSRRPFAWYLERESTVAVSSVQELCAWLKGCDYVCDRELVGIDDHWMHPVDFERLRRGDCEDHALWAWRKLRDLAVPASLVVGELDARSHVWVMFVSSQRLHLLEATEKKGELIRLADSGVGAYRPRYGVDTDLNTYSYPGVRAAPHHCSAIRDSSSTESS